MEVDRNGLEVLSRDQCLRLLGTATLGRIGVTSGALPTVLPVNFRFEGRHILIRTGVGTKLDAATNNAVVAFEADNVDPVAHTGVSVVVRGVACELTDPDALAAAQRLPLARCAPGGSPRRGDFDGDPLGAAHCAGPVGVDEEGRATIMVTGPPGPAKRGGT